MGAGGLRERKKQQTRDRCVAAALRLFRERGYDGATVELIAAEADCSVTTFFRYFESKEDAFLASFLALQERFERALRERPAGVPVLTALRAIVGEVVREFAEHGEGRDHVKAFESVPELLDRMREYQDRPRQIITAAFAEELGVDATDLRPQMLAGAVVGAFESARNAWIAGPRDVPLPDHMMRAFDLVEQMAEPIIHGPVVARRRDP
ncbi:MAG: TetR family transcriptional regulator [Actinomycetota bacterium]